jgi:hypothetical protein
LTGKNSPPILSSFESNVLSKNTLDTGLVYSEPYVTTFLYEPAAAPGEKHFDVHFLFEVAGAAGVNVSKPLWYEALEWFDIGALQRLPFARQHEDVAEA